MDYDNILFNLKMNQYTFIGSGSGRNVYDIGNGYVVKVARSILGHAQNEAEFNLYMYGNVDLFAPILGISNDMNLIVMVKANPLHNFRYLFQFYQVSNFHQLFQLNQFSYIINQLNLVKADLERRSSWGIIDGKPMLIDYGFTKEVKRRYY